MVTNDLRSCTDEQLIRECLKRGYDEEAYYGAVYALQENEYHADDETTGYTEAGLHGRTSDKPVVEIDESKAD